MVREYAYLDSAPVGQVNAGAPETVTYLHTDHLGTPRAGSNAAGAVVWAWANDAFGVSAPTGSATVNLRMAGQYADSESGLFYNWNRYYKPVIGRYISSDPIGLEGGLNTFGYVGQNPVNGVDPSGLMSGCLPGDFGAACDIGTEGTSRRYGGGSGGSLSAPKTTSPNVQQCITPKPGTRVRPTGVPDSWRIRPSESPGGVKYFDPKNPGNQIRVEQGNPNSPYPNSQGPYVRDVRNGQYRDALGNIVPKKDPAGHIPLDQYLGYRP